MTTNGASHPDHDLAEYLTYAGRLADAVESVLSDWVVRCVSLRLVESGGVFDDAARSLAEDAGERCRREVAPVVRELVTADPDAQRLTPLTILRAAVDYPSGVLEQLGVAAVVRDEFTAQAFPRDRYGLVPASFADVDPSLHEPGLAWGAAKAHVHLARRRREGRR